MFWGIFILKKKENIFKLISKINLSEEKIVNILRQAINENRTITIEEEIILNDFDKFFNIDLTPMYSRKRYIGTIVLFKDITEHKQEEKYKMNFGIAFLDIDDFKKVNDTYGHVVGDNVLKQLVQIIKMVLLPKDILCRYGGEEFVILFTKTSREEAIKTAEKIRKLVEKHKFLFNEEIKDGHITVSIGFAAFYDDCGKEKNNILMIADDRLYKVKKTGKNKVIYE